MSEKRRDSKNRILRTGESQEADGRYKFRYIDGNGKRKTVYSWRLVATDSIPAGKRDNAPLREQEKAINRDLNDMITPDGAGLTVLDLVKKYIATKTGVKHTTRAGYGTVINLLDKDPFGARRIDKIRLSDAKEWLIRLQQVDKKSYSAIHSIRGVVRPAFQMAVDDDILRKNPFEFQLATVVVNDAVTREAITRKQERTFLDFIKNDTHYSKYYDGMYILFKTGMRISEFTGLTVKDLDMESRTINIDHQLQKTGTLVYIDTTKTYAGTRVIPMQDDVYECFQRILKNRRPPKVEPMIDGYSGFLCFDKDGKKHLLLQVNDVAAASVLLESKLNTSNFSVMPDKSIHLYDYVENAGKVSALLSANNITIYQLAQSGDSLETYYTNLIGGCQND